MCEVITYQQVRQYDPTKTTQLRNRFAKAMRGRFLELALMIKRSVYNKDCFGLKGDGLQTHQMNPTSEKEFQNSRDAEKLALFLVWLQEQIDKGILELKLFQQVGGSIEGAWTNKYIYDAYSRGVIMARQELINAGYSVPTIEAS